MHFPKTKTKKATLFSLLFFFPLETGVEKLQVCVLPMFSGIRICLCTHPNPQTHFWSIASRDRDRERERGYIEQTGASAKAKSVPAPASPLCMAPVAPEIRPQANKPAWSCQGAQHGSRGGARWHFVARCHFLLPSL